MRRPWLSFDALAWCAVGLVTCPLCPERAESYVGGSMAKLALLVASAAAGAGQWINLNQLPLAPFSKRIRWINKVTIAGSLLLLLKRFTIGILRLLSAIVLLWLVLADLAFTAPSLILGMASKPSGRLS